MVITPVHTTGPNIDIDWVGSDAAPSSGSFKYDVQYKIGNLAYTGWLTDVVYSDTPFRGTPGYTYTFQVRIRDKAGNQSNWVQSSVVEVSKVTKYYTFGASRVAMRQGSVVYYLHGDHLGSTSLTTDANGTKFSESRYLPYGQIRWGSTGPTDFGFTNQRREMGFGLYDYNARYYSQVLGRFISPDTIIPDPTNSNALNRYAYVNNNPLRYVDPSGHEGCTDDACWKKRYYEAHGYRRNHDGEWVQGGDAKFADAEILSDVLGENGITLQGGDTWNWNDLKLIGEGVVAFSNMVGGADRVRDLLGGAVSFIRKAEGSFWGCGSGAAACSTPSLFGGGGTVEFYNSLFEGGGPNFARGTAVHELAHIIDFNNTIGDNAGGWEFIMPFSDAFAEASRFGPDGRSISKYGQSSPQEYWAEAVTDWVYGRRYPSAAGSTNRNVLDPLQVQWIGRTLRAP